MLLSFFYTPTFTMPVWTANIIVYSIMIVAVLFLVQWSELDWKAVRKRLLIGVLLASVLAVAPVHAFYIMDPCLRLEPWSVEWVILGCWAPWA